MWRPRRLRVVCAGETVRLSKLRGRRPSRRSDPSEAVAAYAGGPAAHPEASAVVADRPAVIEQCGPTATAACDDGARHRQRTRRHSNSRRDTWWAEAGCLPRHGHQFEGARSGFTFRSVWNAGGGGHTIFPYLLADRQGQNMTCAYGESLLLTPPALHVCV